MNTDTNALHLLEDELGQMFTTLVRTQTQIRETLSHHANGKKLKGDESVGWFGEVVVKVLFGGKLVDDQEEHDVVTPEGWRISVKARKGFNTGWRRTSAIPKIAGDDCPTHLAFVHLHDDFKVDRIWLFPWEYLIKTNRFQKHMVRGAQRSFMFNLQENKDLGFLIHNNKPNE